MTATPASPPDILPTVLACTGREKARELLRRAFSRRRAKLSFVKSPDALDAALRRTLVDAVVVDVSAGGDDAWHAAAMAREFPSIPFVGLAAPRLADAAALGRCAALEMADVLIEGIDDGAMRELVMPVAFTARFARAMRGAHELLGLHTPMQARAWDVVTACGGRPVRTEFIAAALDVTREHLSRSFAADGAPNLKRVIDLVRLIAAAELAKNAAYDLADVARVLAFASPSHLANTAHRVAGIRAASLTRLRAHDLMVRFTQGRARSRD